MPITFEPMRNGKKKTTVDLTLSLRISKTAKGANPNLELSTSQSIQERLRYLDGDRAVVHFHEDTGAVVIERVAGDRSGYKICLQERADGKPVALIRVTCTPEHVKAILGEAASKAYELFEVDGNSVTFVPVEG